MHTHTQTQEVVFADGFGLFHQLGIRGSEFQNVSLYISNMFIQENILQYLQYSNISSDILVIRITINITSYSSDIFIYIYILCPVFNIIYFDIIQCVFPPFFSRFLCVVCQQPLHIAQCAAHFGSIDHLQQLMATWRLSRWFGATFPHGKSSRNGESMENLSKIHSKRGMDSRTFFPNMSYFLGVQQIQGERGGRTSDPFTGCCEAAPPAHWFKLGGHRWALDEGNLVLSPNDS